MGVRELDLVQDYTGHAYDMVLGLYYADVQYNDDNYIAIYAISAISYMQIRI